MEKQHTGFEFNQNLYDMWMEQTKQFFNSADNNLQGLFSKNAFVDPQEHMQQIQKWLDTLQSQWNVMNLNQQQMPLQKYWKAMAEMSTEASELMLKEWIKRTKDDKPIKDVRELYDLWLSCCHEIYAKKIHQPDYQEMYGEFMNAAMTFWKTMMPK